MRSISEIEALILDSTADAIVLIDDQGNIEFYNRAAADLFGYAPDEILGRNVKQLMPEPDASQHDSHLRRYRETGVAHIVGTGRDVEGRHKDGRCLLLWLRIGELRGPDGRTRFVGSMRDISERRRLEADLRASEARYRHTQILAKVGHWTWVPGPDGNSAGGICEYSTEAADIFGVSPAELAISISEYVERFIYPADRADAMTLFAASNEGRSGSYDGRYRIVRPDGEVRFVQERGERVRDERDKTRFFHGIVQDVTEHAVLEETLRASERRLLEAQAIAMIGSWELDLTNGRLWWSDETYDIFEIEKDRLGTSYQAFLDATHPDDRDLVNKAYTESVASREPYKISHRLRMADGRIKWVDERCHTFYDDAGRPLRSTGTVQDITELKNVVEESLRLASLAKQANQAKSEFLATMSHELRTPLNAIIGFSELLLNYGHATTSDKRQDYHAIILQSGKHLLSLINDILDLAKVESGKLDLDFKTIALPTLVSECISYLEQSALRRSISFRVNIPQIELSSDRRLLKQLLINVLSNAVKFNKENGAVHVTVEQKAQTVSIVIEDTGIGMDEQELVHALEPFVQIESSYQRTREGTGLGLALVHRFTSLLGGKFEIRSVKGIGTTVLIEMPIQSAA